MTAQVHEKIIYNGEKLSMAFCPPIPKNHPKIIELNIDGMDTTIDSTACWRRYIGTWQINGGFLFLTDLTGKYKLVGDKPIFANWFSGVLRIPKGDILHYVHMGFGTVYEKEILVKIINGIVEKTVERDNRGKDFNIDALEIDNFPGFENFFDGDNI